MSETILLETTIVGATVTRSVPTSVGEVPRVAMLRIYDSGGAMGRAAVAASDAVLAELGRWTPFLMGSAPLAAADRRSTFLGLRRVDATGPAWQAFSATESALADLCASRVRAPLHEWLGGKVRDTIPIALVLELGARSVGAVVTEADRAVRALGYRTLALRTAGAELTAVVRTLRALRAFFGGAMGLRLCLTPAATLTPAEQTTLHVAAAPLLLEYVQGDIGPERLPTPPPVVTPRCVGSAFTDVGQLATVVRSGVAQVLALEPLAWGGPPGIVQLGAVCRAFHVELALSCAGVGPYGVALAIHLAAALPSATMGIACEAPDLVGFAVSEGEVLVPDAPGLGIELSLLDQKTDTLLMVGERPGACGADVLPA